LDTVTIVATVAGLSCLLLAAVWLAVRAQRSPPAGGLEAMVDETGEVLTWSGQGGTIRVRGELWKAASDAPLAVGARVRVIAAKSLTLSVAQEDGHTASAQQSEEP